MTIYEFVEIRMRTLDQWKTWQNLTPNLKECVRVVMREAILDFNELRDYVSLLDGIAKRTNGMEIDKPYLEMTDYDRGYNEAILLIRKRLKELSDEQSVRHESDRGL